MRILILCFLTGLLGTTSNADSPRIVTDIAPVHSLVAQVMEGVGTPALILPPDASPHDFALRPSQASALAAADLVIWMGPGLTPWLERSLAALAADKEPLTLLQAEQTILLGFREGAAFEDDDHDDHGHGHDHDHDHGGSSDPHAWLDPQNAIIWLRLIADRLAALDPDHAELYQANATEARRGLKGIVGELESLLSPVRGRPFIVLHDAYHYFEHRFEIEATGAITPGDASRASAGRVQAIRSAIREQGVTCVMSTPQIGRSVLANVIEGTGARIGVLDPIGIDLEPGPGLYPDVLLGMGRSLSDCLGAGRS